MTTPSTDPITNPYVGPRTFTEREGRFFFGREREARDLTARIVSERLLLFYAPSGAGKSSLLYARVIPKLRDEERFQVLPVGRVSGELPAGAGAVDNVYAFNLMTSLHQGDEQSARLAHVTLSDFLARLARETVIAADGQRSWRWAYKPELAVELPAAGAVQPATGPRFVLVIDQFEELITNHPGRWREREAFFRQLNQALLDDPNLWVVLTLREDYVAALDPYAELTFNRLRARFYMERMDKDAALDAIRRPAELGDRPFAPGVAEQLVDNLRLVRVPGQEAPIPGQYVEPVQLQVVCYELWENLEKGIEGTGGTEGTQITFDDLAEAGDVNRALTQFYEETLAAALADPAAAGVSERQLRTWFDKELITEADTRGLVHQDEADTGGLPNGVVRALQRRFLVRGEARGGDTWIELVHDRFVEPIRASNAAWFPQHLSALQRQAALWDEQGRSPGLLLRGKELVMAEQWELEHEREIDPHEQAFLEACRAERARAEKERKSAERERQQNRLIRMLGIGAGVVAILALAAAIWAGKSSAEASRQKRIAVTAQATAEANAKLAQDQLDHLAGLALLQKAYELKEQGDGLGAIEKLRAAKTTNTDLGINVEAEIELVRRQVATELVQEGEALAKGGDFPAAEAKFKAALALEPPPDTPVYVYVPPGEFRMGAGAEDDRIVSQFGWDNSSEHPQHPVTLDGYWIQRTEVTNAQYRRCVEAGGCKPPDDINVRYRNPQFATQPVTGVTWFQARDYAAWAGGRLPTEAEWEKACRGTDGRTYPWGNQAPTGELLNFRETGLGTWSAVGSYPKGASPYGALDMAGNVWEWTADWLDDTYYADSPKENPTGPATGDFRVLRGGSLYYKADLVRCAKRDHYFPGNWFDSPGFRVVVSLGS
ncbi:MAG: SUMF1/EgtB/PvdO family nonheme iron enzyme [Chloroflexi bacterium]|nr:SUMF1/EgtB/PvdO family nonheme iron enzyme [Chloroflexota bacterium]